MKQISDLMNKTNIRSILAVLITLLSFGIIYKVAWNGTITVDDMGLISSITPILAFILGYYFGSNKDTSDFGGNGNGNGNGHSKDCPDCHKKKLAKGENDEVIG
jgi:hypothetical protein